MKEMRVSSWDYSSMVPIVFIDTLYSRIEIVDGNEFWYGLYGVILYDWRILHELLFRKAIFPRLPLFMYHYTECLILSEYAWYLDTFSLPLSIIFNIFCRKKSNQKTSVMHSHKTNLKCSCIANTWKSKSCKEENCDIAIDVRCDVFCKRPFECWEKKISQRFPK